MFSLRSPQAEVTISRVSLFMALQSQTLSLLRKTKDHNSSLSSKCDNTNSCQATNENFSAFGDMLLRGKKRIGLTRFKIDFADLRQKACRVPVPSIAFACPKWYGDRRLGQLPGNKGF